MIEIFFSKPFDLFCYLCHDLFHIEPTWILLMFRHHFIGHLVGRDFLTWENPMQPPKKKTMESTKGLLGQAWARAWFLAHRIGRVGCGVGRYIYTIFSGLTWT